MAETNYIETDHKNFNGASMWQDVPERDVTRLQEDWNKRKKEWKESKLKLMKSVTESDYGENVKDYSSFKLLQDGRSYKKQTLKYQEEFSFDEMMNRAGDDLIIPLPLLIAGQTKLSKDERVRTAPINFTNPKTFEWEIKMTVPAGYQAEGVEDLNRNVANDAGAFICVAAVEGNVVSLKVMKQYRAKYLDVNAWPAVMQFLDAAYKFSQAKIVFTKLKN
ncbi:MAG: hypothetical protein EAY75_13055 [Bacteroidetes bacterium]|nr:MAG: hypothetical protein EAY75_13055 [Bacteroidota bacterium]